MTHLVITVIMIKYRFLHVSRTTQEQKQLNKPSVPLPTQELYVQVQLLKKTIAIISSKEHFST